MPQDPIQKLERWSVPFDENMSEADVDRLLTLTPFREMDPAAFPLRTPLRDILRFDTRLRRFRRGEIIVRAGDYGTSAFMVLEGPVRVVLAPGLPASMLGRREPRRRGLFRILAQMWAGTRGSERVRRSRLHYDEALGTRQDAGAEARVFLQDVPRVIDEHETGVLDGGEFFGELAALTRAPRGATVFADHDGVELLELRWQAVRDLKKNDRAMDAHIQKIFRERALASYLREAPVFRHLTDEARQRLLVQTELVTHGRYEWTGDYKQLVKSGALSEGRDEAVIAQEGDYPNGVALIRSGFARLSRKFGNGRRTLNYLGAGRFYGFREIAHNWRQPSATVPLQYTLSAVGCANVIVIPTRAMEEIVLPGLPKDELPPLFTAAEARADAPLVGEAGGKISEDMLGFLAEQRFFNGTAAMVIDLDRCTRCDDCVRACATAHNNNPRFLRHGPVQDGIMVANACMHCADPVCMIGCPTGAIHRNALGGEVIINKATCIGCSVCANQCPYEAIRMVEIHDEQGRVITDADMAPLHKATKCDLCFEQLGGPACERACPHDALARINMNDLDAFARWLKR